MHHFTSKLLFAIVGCLGTCFGQALPAQPGKEVFRIPKYVIERAVATGRTSATGFPIYQFQYRPLSNMVETLNWDTNPADHAHQARDRKVLFDPISSDLKDPGPAIKSRWEATSFEVYTAPFVDKLLKHYEDRIAEVVKSQVNDKVTKTLDDQLKPLMDEVRLAQVTQRIKDSLREEIRQLIQEELKSAQSSK